MTRMQKDFDIQSVIYGLKGLEEYTKKELLLMNTRLLLVEGALKEERRRPMSAKKTIETRMGSSVSYKKLVPVDCISCFGNPLTDKLQVSLGTSLPRRN